MIWYAIRVTPQREFLFERLLRMDGLDPFVPVKYVAKRKSKRTDKRELMAYPQHPGLMFIRMENGETVPWERVRRFDKLFRSIVTDNCGNPRAFREFEAICISGQSHRPFFVNPNGRKKRRRFQPNAEIISGPHQGRLVKVYFPDQLKSEKPANEADELFELATGT